MIAMILIMIMILVIMMIIMIMHRLLVRMSDYDGDDQTNILQDQDHLSQCTGSAFS